MKAATPGIVWQWQCDYCYRYFGPKAATEASLPNFSQMVTDGWSIGRVHGDVCPSCLADGVQPSSERHPANAAVESAVRADMPREVQTVEYRRVMPDGRPRLGATFEQVPELDEGWTAEFRELGPWLLVTPSTPNQNGAPDDHQ